jgi:hypothetical protein
LHEVDAAAAHFPCQSHLASDARKILAEVAAGRIHARAARAAVALAAKAHQKIFNKIK